MGEAGACESCSQWPCPFARQSTNSVTTVRRRARKQSGAVRCLRRTPRLGGRRRGRASAQGYDLVASWATWRRAVGGVVSRPYRSLEILGTNTQDFILG